MGAAVRLVKADGVFCTGVVGKVLVVIWRGKPTLDRVNQSVEPVTGGGYGFLGIVEEGSAIPDPDVRKRAEEIQRTANLLVRASVIEGNGLLTSLSRTTIRGLFALARIPVHIGASVEDVAPAVARAMGMPALELTQGVRELRAQYAASVPVVPAA